MKVYAIDLFARVNATAPTRSVQVLATSLDDALRQAQGDMACNETALRPSGLPRLPMVRALDVKL